MTEERLKEIKDNIQCQYDFAKFVGEKNFLLDEELELYNEVVRLREIIDKVEDKLYCWGEVLDADFQKGMLDILKQNNLTLEQFTGVDNA